jgi:hypothetical protein
MEHTGIELSVLRMDEGKSVDYETEHSEAGTWH